MRILAALALVIGTLTAQAAGPLDTTARNATHLVATIGGAGGVTNKVYRLWSAPPGTNYYAYTVAWHATNLPSWASLTTPTTLTSDVFTNGDWEYKYWTNAMTRLAAHLVLAIDDSYAGTNATNITIAWNDGVSNHVRTNLSIRIRSAANTYYVATNGDNGADGLSPATAWLTLTKASGSSVPGDTIVVGNGKYAERVTVSGATNSPDRTTWITNYSGAMTRSDMTNLSMAATETLGFDIQRDNVTVQGFGVTNTAPTGVNNPGIRIDGNNAQVQNNFVHDNPGRQYPISGYWYDQVHNGLVSSNIAYYNSDGYYCWWFNTKHRENEALRLRKYTTDDCDYSNFWGDGNRHERNWYHGTLSNEVVNAHVDGFQTYDDPSSLYWAANTRITKNVVGEFHEGVITEAKTIPNALLSTNLLIDHNVFANGLGEVGGSTNGVRPIIIHDVPFVTVTNNTFFNVRFCADWATFGGAPYPKGNSNGVFFNNLSYNTAGGYYAGNLTNFTSGYNAVYSPDGRQAAPTNFVATDIANVNPQVVALADPIGPDLKAWTQDDGFLLGAANVLRTSGQGGVEIGAYENLTPPAPPGSFYVSLDGSDGTGDGSITNPWRTVTFAIANAGGNSIINVGAGTFDRFTADQANQTIVGTLNGAQWQTVIDPSLLVTNGWVAASEIGAGVYKQTGLAFETKELSIGGKRVLYVQTTNDISSGMNAAYTSSGITKGSTLLSSSSSLVLTSAFSGQSIQFWNSIGALWASTNGTTYLRLANGTSPNGLSIRMAGNLDGSWTDDAKSNTVKVTAANVTLRDLDLRGSWCQALFLFSSNTVMDHCALTGGRYRVEVNSATNTILTNCTLTTDYYGYADPGAWQGKTNTGNRENLYLVSKFLSGQASQVVSDTGALVYKANNLAIRNCTFTKNIGDNVWVGDDSGPSQSVTISSNSFANSSAHGIFYLPGETNTIVVGNSFSDINVHNRLQYMDNGDARTIKIYRNMMWNPAGAGEAFYAHYSGATPSVWPIVWVYWNSISGGLCGLDTTPTTATGINGTVFVNNVFSGSQWLLTYSMAFMTNADRVGAFDYNLITPPAVTYPTNAPPAWWGASNRVAATIVWSTNSVPNFQLPGGSTAINSALDVASAFTLRGTNYSALPNTAVTKLGAGWDMGAVESPMSPSPTYQWRRHGMTLRRPF